MKPTAAEVERDLKSRIYYPSPEYLEWMVRTRAQRQYLLTLLRVMEDGDAAIQAIYDKDRRFAQTYMEGSIEWDLVALARTLAAQVTLLKGEQKGTQAGPNDTRICYAPGDRCQGCEHYYGRAPECKYKPEQNGTPVIYGPEKQAYPGAPVYRVGTSIGVELEPQNKTASGNASGLDAGRSTEVSDALELAELLLRGIVKTHYDVLRYHDVDAFVMNILNPAKVAAGKWRRQLLSMQKLLDRDAGRSNEPAAWMYSEKGGKGWASTNPPSSFSKHELSENEVTVRPLIYGDTADPSAITVPRELLERILSFHSWIERKARDELRAMLKAAK